MERVNDAATSEQEFIDGLRTEIQPQLAGWPTLAPTVQLRDAATVLGNRINEVIAVNSVEPFNDEAVAAAGSAVTSFCGEPPEDPAG